MNNTIGFMGGALVAVWIGSGFILWVANPELTHMQIFLKMLGVG